MLDQSHKFDCLYTVEESTSKLYTHHRILFTFSCGRSTLFIMRVTFLLLLFSLLAFRTGRATALPYRLRAETQSRIGMVNEASSQQFMSTPKAPDATGVTQYPTELGMPVLLTEQSNIEPASAHYSGHRSDGSIAPAQDDTWSHARAQRTSLHEIQDAFPLVNKVKRGGNASSCDRDSIARWLATRLPADLYARVHIAMSASPP